MPFLFVLILVSCQQEESIPFLSEEFSINSASTGATYTINVAFPQDYNPNTQSYATMYVLDGEENFNFVAENCERISRELSTSNVMVVTEPLIIRLPMPMKVEVVQRNSCCLSRMN